MSGRRTIIIKTEGTSSASIASPERLKVQTVIVGVRGHTGAVGPQGAQGNAGPTGEQGVPGVSGPPGRGVDYDESGTFAERDDYDDEDQGFAFLQTDVLPFRLWVKATPASADWSGPNYVGGAAAIGDLGRFTDSVVEYFDLGRFA